MRLVGALILHRGEQIVRAIGTAGALGVVGLHGPAPGLDRRQRLVHVQDDELRIGQA